ncbi:hypothetical protein KTT58_18035 [Pseudomonas viridiflava]|uniref:hypothetical protein n=1 Tax=Pseudomonas viridiflava TaxID=33069 RepID=UPI001C2D2E29|nr:hypothetical protein [Pseudomonas viridiflava]MBV1814640.1 hypothetical protein [Pseudomonas viridiflava]
MHNYTHKKIAEFIKKLDVMPSDPHQYDEWITAAGHLRFLTDNANSDEVVIFANGEYTYVDTILVPRKWLIRTDRSKISSLTFDSYSSVASYVWGGGKKDVWVERGVQLEFNGKRVGSQLVFCRSFEGWEGKGQHYVEINQEYAHIAGVHWRPEKNAYCRFDELGDLEATVSITNRNTTENLTLVTFKWDELEKYLSAMDSVLVRRFDFTLLRRDKFNGWPNMPPIETDAPNEMSYHQLVCPGHAAYTTGRQIIRPKKTKKSIQNEIRGVGGDFPKRKFAEFVAFDFRNDIVTEISTSPEATTNYFQAEGNSLPFELSPAFFRPEVLSKYKTDRDKYSFVDRDLYCRNAWGLRGIDVNEAGQVHAYICDLRNIPYKEQLHWLSYNEKPKSSISQRAIINDFQGQWVDSADPLRNLLNRLRDWNHDNTAWWSLSDEKLLERVVTPISASRDEWADAIMDLAKLVVEGFQIKPIRAKLDKSQIVYMTEERSISLLEKLYNHSLPLGSAQKLSGLRSVQLLRSKVKGHVTGSEGEELTERALLDHETFSDHFRYICTEVENDLKNIEKLFSDDGVSTQ